MKKPWNTGSSAFADDDPKIDVIARLDRAIQYAALPEIGLKKPWNTGSSAFADDDLKIDVIARLDRAIQYAAASQPIAGALEYWITRLRG